MIDIERLREGLGDHYTVVRELGRGGMATVYLAEDMRHQRKVAIKVLHPDLAAAVGADRFRREIQIATSLTHPNILALYDSGEAAGYLYYVMPLVEGESLRDRLDRERQLSIEDAVRLGVEVANALDYAHRRNVLHRDIKPENILLEDGHAIVADFGVARAISAAGDEKLTQTGMAIGTPTYMSPEQALADKSVDARSDQYALGCVIYEMLAGQPPFTGASMQALIMRHTLEPVPSLRVVRQTVPEELEQVILRTLAKSPADRWPSLKEFAQALVAPTTVTWAWRTPTIGMTGTMALPAKRGRSRRLIGGVVAGVLLAGGLVGWRVARASRSHMSDDELAARRHVAVLYFDDASPGHSLAYLADGLTESLIDRLSKVEQLDVVSRSGVLPWRGEAVSRDSVAKALKVGTIVQGSVEPDGEQVRVTVKLVDGLSGAEVDKRTFTTPAGNQLALRDSLASEVGDFLRQLVGREIRLGNERAATTSSDAWVLVQRAERARKDAEGLVADDSIDEGDMAFLRADSLLARAAAADPRWTEPVAQRAWVAYRRARISGVPADQVALAAQAIAHADSALALDAGHSSALEVRGTTRYFLYLAHLIPDPRESARAIERAEQDLVASTQRDPHNAGAWTSLSHLYMNKPDFAQAKLAALNAYREDAWLAKAPDILDRLYQSSYLTETFTDADHWCAEGRSRFPRDPRFVECRLWLLAVPKLARNPSPDSAWRLTRMLDSLLPPRGGELRRRTARIPVAIVLGNAKLADSARRVLDRTGAGDSELDPQGDLLAYVAYAHLAIGDRDASLALLERYVTRNPEHRDGWRKDSAWWWRNLESDPRFVRLMGG